MADLKIIFMGTPEFAVPSLRILHESGCHIVGVVTAPDRPKGRGKKILGTPVKEYADSQNLRVLQPTNLKDEAFLQSLKALDADLQIVVAFRMLPEAVWDMPEKGTFNLHASLLPQYRGAAPINWAIINGEKTTGITTFFLKDKIDTGNIILQEAEDIAPSDSVGELYARLMEKGSQLVLKSVRLIEEGNVTLTSQVETNDLQPAPKIHSATCEINWDWSSERIRNFVRGLSPYPAAWTTLIGKKFKIFKVEVADHDAKANAKEMVSDNKTFISMRTSTGAVKILELQMEGKKRMKTGDFLRGFKFN